MTSSVFNNVLKSDTFGKYLYGKAVCRIPCTPGTEANGILQSVSDEFQCNSLRFRAGTGNRFVSDTHIVCIAPAGVGISHDLTVAVGSTQLDGPSPVPNMRSETQWGQSNFFGRALAKSPTPTTIDGPILVDSAFSLFGYGSCIDIDTRKSTGLACATSTQCGTKSICSSNGSVFLNIGSSIPSVFSSNEAVAVVSVDYDANSLQLARGSLTSSLVSDIYRVPGINVLPSDNALDQMTFSASMFSYERPTIKYTSPRLGSVMSSRQITVDGVNFGLQTRYMRVLIQGIPYKLHPFGEVTIRHEHVCCQCIWQCLNTRSPRTCRCVSQKELGKELGSPILGTCIQTSTTGACTYFVEETCKVFTGHEQIQTAVPNLYPQYNQGLLPIYGIIPKQSINPSNGDKQFQLCVLQDPWCPLSTVPDTYKNWLLTVMCPTMTKPDMQVINDYKGVSGSDPATFYLVTLKEPLSVKPECDDVLKVCCTFTLTYQDLFLNIPMYNFYDRYHQFPGFCGQHLVRLNVDGHESFTRGMQMENMNLQSLLFYDDKPVNLYQLTYFSRTKYYVI